MLPAPSVCAKLRVPVRDLDVVTLCVACPNEIQGDILSASNPASRIVPGTGTVLFTGYWDSPRSSLTEQRTKVSTSWHLPGPVGPSVISEATTGVTTYAVSG